MFKSNQELYDFVDLLISKLDTADEQQWASSFRDAKTISALPGEILGEMRAVLRGFNKTPIPKSLGVKREVREAVKYVNKALGIFTIFDGL